MNGQRAAGRSAGRFYARGHPEEICQHVLTGSRCVSREDKFFPARLERPMGGKGAMEDAEDQNRTGLRQCGI